MSENPIAQYLDQLERELRAKRAPRSRLLAEAADHLAAAADDFGRSGISRIEAERQAVARFGAAAVVASRFAHAVASTAARTALAWATTAYVAYAAAAAVFLVAAPSWLRDFPQGAPSMLALQVGAVALVLSGVHTLRCRSVLLIDELRLRLIGNGLVIATVALAIAAGLELLLALMRPAAAPWSDVAAVIAIYAVAAAAALVAAFRALSTLARTRVIAAFPRPRRHDLPATASLLVDDVAAAAPPLRPLAVLIASRPLLACAATAALAFAAIASVDAAGSDFATDASAIGGAAATGLFEAVAVVVAYVALARALGLRASRRRPTG